VRSNTIDTSTLPVAPAGDVLETLIEVSVLEIFGADQTRPTRRINEVVEHDRARTSILASPSGRFRTTKFAIARFGFGELDRGHFCLVKCVDAAFACMLEQQLVCFRSDHIPGVTFGATRSDEVGI
jgi:hypothetical protein